MVVLPETETSFATDRISDHVERQMRTAAGAVRNPAVSCSTSPPLTTGTTRDPSVFASSSSVSFLRPAATTRAAPIASANIIEVKDLDAAIAIAARIPGGPTGVEIRPLVERPV